MLVFTTAAVDAAQCREALANYNQLVTAIHAAVRDYERCLTASLARDDCGAEFIELQATHRDFERAVDERAATCGLNMTAFLKGLGFRSTQRRYVDCPQQRVVVPQPAPRVEAGSRSADIGVAALRR